MIRRNAILNLAGIAAPLVVAVVTLPVLIDGYGLERFGVLSLAWALVGYFTLFDLGVARALTKLVAERGSEDAGTASGVRAGLSLMLMFGAIAAVLLAVLAGPLVDDALRISAHLRDETRTSFQVLALAVPPVILAGGLRGVLEAQGRFGVTTALRAPASAATFLAPLAVLPFTRELVPAMWLLVAVRWLALAAFAVASIRALPALATALEVSRTAVPALLGLGAWITVSNVVGTLLANIDRFVIASVLSVTAVAYYAAPFEAVTKLWIVPLALSGVLFPAFASRLPRDPEHARSLLGRGMRALALLLLPIVLAGVILAQEALTLWVGPDFARESVRVTQWLLIGAFVSSLGWLPIAYLQASGRADIPAKVHLAEVPLYLAVLVPVVTAFGIEGAALAAAGRMIAETIVAVALVRWLDHRGPLGASYLSRS